MAFLLLHNYTDFIVIYYQQYDIAPYSSGIPEFLLPFDADTSNV